MKYLLRMVRPRFEVKLVEVDAESDAMAKLTATAEALGSKTGWKLIARSTENYLPHIERCLSETGLGANEMTEEEAREELASIAPPDLDKYLLSTRTHLQGRANSSLSRGCYDAARS